MNQDAPTTAPAFTTEDTLEVTVTQEDWDTAFEDLSPSAPSIEGKYLAYSQRCAVAVAARRLYGDSPTVTGKVRFKENNVSHVFYPRATGAFENFLMRFDALVNAARKGINTRRRMPSLPATFVLKRDHDQYDLLEE